MKGTCGMAMAQKDFIVVLGLGFWIYVGLGFRVYRVYDGSGFCVNGFWPSVVVQGSGLWLYRPFLSQG